MVLVVAVGQVLLSTLFLETKRYRKERKSGLEERERENENDFVAGEQSRDGKKLKVRETGADGGEWWLLAGHLSLASRRKHSRLLFGLKII
jgi:hypothetical protein